MKKYRGSLLLLLASLIWGMAFVAQAKASGIGSFTFNACRCGTAAVFLAGILFIRDRRIHADAISLKAGISVGIVLYVATNLQQLAIISYPPEAAASGRSGFITATYVVMVSIVSIFRKKKAPINVLTAVVLCMIGMYLLCMSGGFSSIYPADIICFGGAIAFTAQILVIDHYPETDAVAMSFVQWLTCFAFSGISALLFDRIVFADIAASMSSILYTGILSSGVAYTLQIIGQKDADPAPASIIMSLESVFALLGGWLFLSERLSGRELLGCLLVFSAVILSQLSVEKE